MEVQGEGDRGEGLYRGGGHILSQLFPLPLVPVTSLRSCGGDWMVDEAEGVARDSQAPAVVCAGALPPSDRGGASQRETAVLKDATKGRSCSWSLSVTAAMA